MQTDSLGLSAGRSGRSTRVFRLDDAHDRRMGTNKQLMEDEEKQWWFDHDDVEPLIGVPTVGAAPVPLIDTADNEPEPGVAAEQESR